MEIFFFFFLVLLIGTNYYFAPKIVREKASFLPFSILLSVFDAGAYFLFGKYACVYTLLGAMCICVSGYVFLLLKKKKHNPLPLDAVEISSENSYWHYHDAELAKISYYKSWFYNLIKINLLVYCLFLLLWMIL